jgi:CelD/BcsL family acetyltransferase involved in cellulose biosynthesis
MLHELTDERGYEAELSCCAGVTAFHRWFFLSALAEALGLRMHAFAVDAGGERLGVLPVLLRRRGPVSTANYLPVPHVGPVLRAAALRDGRVAEVLAAADRFLARHRVVVTKWCFAPGAGLHPDQVAGRGFEVGNAASYVVPAGKSPAAYLAALSAKQRAAIKRGEARGLRTGPATREEIANWFPRQVGAPYLRQGLAPDYSQAAATTLAERLADDPRLLWRAVRAGDGGQLLAVNACLVDAGRLWGWILAAERVPGPSPQVAAYWDAIRWSLDRGLACDFGGAPTAGIRDFKIAMGGEPEHGLVAERVRPRLYRAARAIHARLTAPHLTRENAKSQSNRI